MSRALENEFALLRTAAARLPTGGDSYERAREILANVRTITLASSALSHHEALLLVRKGREEMERLR